MTLCSVPHMRKQGGGKVVNISSRSAFWGETGYIAYAASKAAMIKFTRFAARSPAKDNILIYGVAPRFIEAGMGVESIRQRRRNSFANPLRQDWNPTGCRQCRPFPCIRSFRLSCRLHHRRQRRLILALTASLSSLQFFISYACFVASLGSRSRECGGR